MDSAELRCSAQAIPPHPPTNRHWHNRSPVRDTFARRLGTAHEIHVKFFPPPDPAHEPADTVHSSCENQVDPKLAPHPPPAELRPCCPASGESPPSGSKLWYFQRLMRASD